MSCFSVVEKYDGGNDDDEDDAMMIVIIIILKLHSLQGLSPGINGFRGFNEGTRRF